MKRFMKVVILALIPVCVLFFGCTGAPETESTPEQTSGEQAAADYETTLFDSSRVHKIDVRISEEDWGDLLENATEKTKYKADIAIDGETVEEVSFATKGNSSLFFVAIQPEASRYSFKVNFGKYVKGQTFHGLKTLSLNNGFCDPGCMKDYFCYDMFREMGVPAPLTSYVWLTINGRDHGLYLAVEDESESFLEREYGGEGVIYKPESEELGLTLEKARKIMETGYLPTAKDPHGADLVYVDDRPESYPDIFENAETDSSKQDEQAMLAAIKCLAEGKDLDACLDTDEIIRFFAVHNFVLNYDSYTGAMLHNLVLAESKGRLSAVPWDYNASFGTFTLVLGQDLLKDATGILNLGIDSPLIGTEEDSRPLWKWITGNEKYLEKYHNALDTLVKEYFDSGKFEQKVDALYEMLLPCMEKDPTAFFSAEECGKGAETLKQFCLRRAESVKKQLGGELAAVSEEQKEQDRVDASDIRISNIGAFELGKQ